MIHTECGILLEINSNTNGINEIDFIKKLKKLQHRGREAYGIARLINSVHSLDNDDCELIKYKGVIKDENHLTNDKTTDVYNTIDTNSNYFLGHTRYATSGNKDSSDLIQPIKLDTNQIVVNNLVDNDSNTLKLKRTPIFFAFNGNIKESLWDNLNISYPFLSRQQINTSLNDTQKMKLFIEYLLNMSNNLDSVSKIILKELPTAFCLIISTNDTTWIIRDSLGNRPLSIWADKNISNITDTTNTTNTYDTIDLNKVIISSETNVINQESEFYDENYKWFNIEHNSILKLFHSRHQNKITLQYLYLDDNLSKYSKTLINSKCNTQKFCLFEKIYFMNSKSTLTDSNIQVAIYRKKLANLLIQQIINEKKPDYLYKLFNNQNNKSEINKKIDNLLLVGIPETGIEYAKGISDITGIKISDVIKKKNNYNYRTFICANDQDRYQACIDKYDINTELIKKKDLILVDDSIVRGNTLNYLITFLKKHKPKSIHIMIPSPPVANPCYYGVDIPTREELIINKVFTIENIKKKLKIDSLSYLNIKYIQQHDNNICDMCFTGKDIIDF